MQDLIYQQPLIVESDQEITGQIQVNISIRKNSIPSKIDKTYTIKSEISKRIDVAQQRISLDHGNHSSSSLHKLQIKYGSDYLQNENEANKFEWKDQQQNSTIRALTKNKMILKVRDIVKINHTYRIYNYNDSESTTSRNQVLDKLDIAFTILYTTEAAIKIFAQGFVMHKRSYLRDYWNIMDFSVVIIGLLAMIPTIPSLKSLRTLRVLRPLRSIKTIPSMKRLVKSLLMSMPQMLNVVLFLLFVFIIFGILGNQLFAGDQYKRCRLTEKPISKQLWPLDQTQLRLCGGMYECNPGTFCGSLYDYDIPIANDNLTNSELVNYDITKFDNLLYSLLTIFQSITQEGWSNLMYNYMDSEGEIACFFFPLLIIVGSFFLLNLFLAVIMSTFTEMEEIHKEKEEQKRLQQEYEQSGKKKKKVDKNINKMFRVNQKKVQVAKQNNMNITSAIHKAVTSNQVILKENAVDQNQTNEMFDLGNKKDIRYYLIKTKVFFMKLCTHQIFSFAITLTIILNTICLAMDKYPADLKQDEIIGDFNIVFFSIFLLELVIKIIGLGPKNYIKDRFNIFDAIIVILSVVDVILDTAIQTSISSGNGAISAFRAFRLLRIFKLAKSWKKLQALIKTVVNSVKDISIFSILLFLFIYTYILLGLELFAFEVRFNDNNEVDLLNGTSPRINFDSFFNGFLTLFQVLTTENWDSVMYQFVRAKGIIAALYFISFMIIGQMILLNLFLAILLKNFDESELVEKFDNNQQSIRVLVYSKIKEYFTKVKSFIHLGRSKSSSNAIVPLQKEEIMIQFEKGSVLIQPQLQPSNQREKRKTLMKLQLGQLGESSNEEKKEGEINNDSQNQSIDLSRDEYRELLVNDTNKESIKTPITPITPITPLVFEKSSYSQRLPQHFNYQNIMGQTLRERIERSPFNKDFQQQQFYQTQKTNQFNSSMASPSLKRRKSIALMIKEQQLQNSKKISTEDIKPTLCEGNSLFAFKPENKMRLLITKIVTKPNFDYVVLTLIGIQSILLAVDNPLNDPNGTLNDLLFYSDIVFTVIFAIESIAKIIAFGLLFNKSKSYLRNPWNIIDFIVVILSILSLIIQNDKLKIVKILRLLRVLRPLRVISRNKGLKIAVQALLMAIPNIINVIIISMLFFLIFGIIGVNYFKGAFYYCYSDNIDESLQQSIITKFDCVNFGGEWLNNDDNFDNIFQAMATLFQISTTEGWVVIMHSSIDSVGIDYQPQIQFNEYWAIFYVIFIIVANFFVLNLFVGVVVSTFNREKELLGKNFLLTNKQKQWLEQKKLVIKIQPLHYIKVHEKSMRSKVLQLVQNRKFEIFSMVCIILNTILLTISWYDEPIIVSDVTDYINYGFAAIFGLEAILKLIGQGPKIYFKDGWNKFDFIIVVGTVISILLTAFTNIQIGAASTFIRAFRISRIFRLIKKAKRLKTVFETFIVAIPALTNVGGLLMLFVYIYSILGMFLFAEIKQQSYLDEHANFQSFGLAFLTLIRISTGESWDYIMLDAMRERSIIFQCSYDDFEYEFYKNNNFQTQSCGASALAGYAYFYSFVIFVSLIFLNLFIAIIIQGFEDINQKEIFLISEDTILEFQKIWSEFDQNATGFIKITDFPVMMLKLGLPLGWDQSYLDNIEKQDDFLEELNIPTYNNFQEYLFWDVIQGLTKIYMIKQSLKKSMQALHQQSNRTTEFNEMDDLGEIDPITFEKKIHLRMELEFENYDEEKNEVIDVQTIKLKEKKLKKSIQQQQDELSSAHIKSARKIMKAMQQYQMKKTKTQNFKFDSTIVKSNIDQLDRPANQQESYILQPTQELRFDRLRNQSEGLLSPQNANYRIPAFIASPMNKDLNQVIEEEFKEFDERMENSFDNTMKEFLKHKNGEKIQSDESIQKQSKRKKSLQKKKKSSKNIMPPMLSFVQQQDFYQQLDKSRDQEICQKEENDTFDEEIQIIQQSKKNQ